ncbi:unnamed protein product [Lampetra planeri]
MQAALISHSTSTGNQGCLPHQITSAKTRLQTRSASLSARWRGGGGGHSGDVCPLAERSCTERTRLLTPARQSAEPRFAWPLAEAVVTARASHKSRPCGASSYRVASFDVSLRAPQHHSATRKLPFLGNGISAPGAAPQHVR